MSRRILWCFSCCRIASFGLIVSMMRAMIHEHLVGYRYPIPAVNQFFFPISESFHHLREVKFMLNLSSYFMFHEEEYYCHKGAHLTMYSVLLHIATANQGDLVESYVLKINSCITKQYAPVSIFLDYRVDRKFKIPLSSYVIIRLL